MAGGHCEMDFVVVGLWWPRMNHYDLPVERRGEVKFLKKDRAMAVLLPILRWEHIVHPGNSYGIVIDLR